MIPPSFSRHLVLAAIFMALCGAVVLPSLSTFAQEATPLPVSDDQVNAVAKQLFCPVCENTPLDVCPTTACEEWRQLIREKLSIGWTPDQVKNYFITQYGDRVVGTPPARGLNWLIYVIPPLIILAGIYILYRAVFSGRKPGPKTQPPVPPVEPLDDEYVSRLEEEVSRR